MIDTIESLDLLISKVKKAQEKFSQFSQEEVDRIFKHAALAANVNRIPLAKLAVAETGMGLFEDKVIKNHFASEYIYNRYKNEKTCGVFEQDPTNGIIKIAEPLGILAGVIPVTNPTSTAIFKALITLKTRNAIIFAPHPKATKCTIESAKIVLKAAIEAGAPEDIIAWIDTPSIETTQYLMQHPDISTILATGGPSMVKAAYSSGKPAIGVGAGNTPALIDETSDISMAVNSITMSKNFDYGTICASEQSVVVVDKIYGQVREEFIKRGNHILNNDEKAKLSDIILNEGKLNGQIVGKSPYEIGKLAGINIDKNIRVIIAEVEKVGTEEPFSYEKLSPILAMYRASNFEEGVETAQKLIHFGGMGHTSSLYTHPSNRKRIEYFSQKMPTGRILINTPSSHGAIGDLYNFKLDPSLTLGCGSWGGNSTSANVGINNLINIKVVAERRENMLWYKVPSKIYFKPGSISFAMDDLKDKKRAFIVTDKPLYDLGLTKQLSEILDKNNTIHEIFFDVNPDPSFDDIQRGVEKMNQFKPDLIIAIGGGSPMDAAKIMWLLHEYPDVKFEDLAMRFMDIRKRVYEFPKLGKKAYLVCIPTTSGTGAEVTPFAVVTDNRTGIKYPITDYELTPDMAIIDPDLVMTMPPKLTAYGGLDALTHAIESFVSVYANDFTNAQSLQAIETVFKYLPESYKMGAEAHEAKEKMHYGATIAGMAFSNAFLGLNHSLAHTLGSAFHIPHGLANAMLLTQIIQYNRTDRPYKQGTLPQYKYPQAKERYVEIANYLKLEGSSDEEKIDSLIDAINALKREVEVPMSIRDFGISEIDFFAKLETLAIRAFDDQCTGANPRYPLIEDIKKIYIAAFNGVTE
jgi:acetaldehyde dehydrogenase / alcohol dehydrogenase